MSSAVVAPVGKTLVLQGYVIKPCSSGTAYNDSRVVLGIRGVLRTEFIWPYSPCKGREHELHKHVHGSDEQREGEAIVVGCEHPFVVQGEDCGKEEPSFGP